MICNEADAEYSFLYNHYRKGETRTSKDLTTNVLAEVSQVPTCQFCMHNALTPS